jgi:glycosyltransferase involved in cell wall biosynthesis
MKIFIWNSHWATLGGGEVYSAILAKTLYKKGFSVILLGNQDASIMDLVCTRLGIDIRNLPYFKISHENEIHGLLSHEDLFINASFGSKFTPNIEKSIYICHFPQQQKIANLFAKILEPRPQIEVRGVFQNKSSFIFGETLLFGSGFVNFKFIAKISIECVQGSVYLEERNGEKRTLNRGEIFEYSGSNTIKVRHMNGISSVTRITSDWQEKLTTEFLARTHTRLTFAAKYKQIWSNSQFTQEHLLSRWKRESYIVYPPIPQHIVSKKEKKQNQIISIGRFVDPAKGHSKNQFELLKAFERLCSESSKEWHLYMIGGVDNRNRNYYHKVMQRAAKSGLTISVIPDCPDELKIELLSTSKFFWHGAGLKVHPRKPERMEHFGISVVEAILNKCIPLVHINGGPSEIVRHRELLTYSSVFELATKTLSLDQQDNRELMANLLSDSTEFLDFEKTVLMRIGEVSNT